MKLWLDDIRPAPTGWTWVKTAEEALSLLKTGTVEEASLDHDLDMAEVSADPKTGFLIGQINPGARSGMWLIEQMIREKAWPTKRITVHSQSEMKWAMNSLIRKHWPGRQL